VNSSDNDYDFLAGALPAFISEAREQVAAIEQWLLELEADPNDRDHLDALFRSAHTIKGSAGLFGLETLVDFTHHIETLLDHLRDGQLQLDAGLSSLLLACNDQILALVDEAGGGTQDDIEHQTRRQDLVQRLQAAMAPLQTQAPLPTPGHPDQQPPPTEKQASGRWFLTARFGTECFRNGMDPLSILSYLGTRCDIVAVASDRGMVPGLEQLDPESCHYGIELALQAQDPQAAIDDAFSFAREDCALHLIPPEAPTSRFIELLDECTDQPRLGQLLVSVGAITDAQLLQGLKAQADVRAGQADHPGPRIGEILQAQTGLATEVLDAAVKKQQRPRDPADDQRYLRVHADRLDAVINLLGELVIAAAGAELVARQTRNSALIEANQQVGALIEEIRNGTLQLRMVPIGETFSRFRRVVRDTAAELGKDVALEIAGGDTELDKSMVEKIADPLMHLVRNGLDHGLESPAERLAAGKPGQGRLELSAHHESGSILIRIRDDGRGIHRQRVLQRAWDRGLVPRDLVPPDKDILQLIFEPGFSTAEQVTNLSGRGVGMDVVRKNIESLRGQVTLDSEEGLGTTIDIRLPLTLAIIDGFLVSVGASKFVLPLDTVVEVIERRGPAEGLEPSTDPASMDHRGRYCMRLRGELLPVVNLRRLYGLESDPPARISVVVVQAGHRRYGIEVDQLLGQQQTVIKPLGRMFRTLRGISGSSILGSGEVALIVDVLSLGALAASALARPTHASEASPRPPLAATS